MKTVFVSGASSGIGFAIAKTFIDRGFNVIAHGRSLKKLESLFKKELRSRALLRFVIADFRNEIEISEMLSSLKSQISHLDVLVNCAGTEGLLNRYDQISLKEYDELFQVNVLAIVNTCIKLCPILNSGGHIINIGSIGGSIGLPESCHYTLSKSALVGFTKSLSVELASKKVYVNSLSPGATQTPMIERVRETSHTETSENIPIGRVAEPMEIAQFVFNLACSEYITGQNYIIDGGMLRGAG